MAFRRRFIHLDDDAVTVIQTLSDTAIADPRGITAWFEKLRIGGDGPGELVLKDKFTLRGQIEIDHHIAFEYDSGERWYLGRVESVQEESPKGVRVTLHGLWSSLNEVYPGGYAKAGLDKPHRMAAGDYWPNDPDHGLQTVDVVGNVDDFVYTLYNRYIGPRSNVALGTVEAPSPAVTLDGFVFRGEDSAAEILRSLAIFAKGASVGVDEYRRLFFIQKRSKVIGAFREGVNLESLKRETDRALLFNGLQLTGGFIYNENPLISPYRYTGFFRQANSVHRHGMRVARLYVPWVRRNADALRFAREFFRKYGNPTVRYPVQTNCRETLLRPWLGQVRLQAFDGDELVTGHFDRIRVDFDHCPIFSITVGPEEIEFPDVPDDRSRALPMVTGDGESEPSGSVSSFGTYTGTLSQDFSGTGTEISATSHATDDATSIDSSDGSVVTCVARRPQGWDEFDIDEPRWNDPQNMLAPGYELGPTTFTDLPTGDRSARIAYLNFGFTSDDIPADATIVGVAVILKVTADQAGPNAQIIEERVRLFDYTAATFSSDNKANQVGTSWPTGAASDRRFGGANDLWNCDLTPQVIYDPNFGFELVVRNNGSGANTADLLSVEMVVCWRQPTVSCVTRRPWFHDPHIDGAVWADPQYPLEPNYGVGDAVNSLLVGQISETLEYREFRFSDHDIPVGATIKGVSVAFEGWALNPGGNIDETSVRLTVGGVAAGDDRVGQVTTPWSHQVAERTYGGSTDLWGLSLTRADIISAGFGVAFRIDNSGAEDDAAYLAGVTMTVCWEAGVESSEAPPESSAPPVSSSAGFCPGGAFSREFSEANGTLLSAIGFGGDAADWNVQDGKAVAEIPLNTPSFATFEGTGAPSEWTATFTAILVDDAGGTLNVAYNSFRFCMVDTDNFMELQIASTGNITLNQWVAGTPSVLSTQSFGASNGQVVEVTVTRDGSGNLSAASNVATTLTGTQTEHMAATQMALFSYLDGADAPTVAYPAFDDLCVQDNS